MISEPLHLIAYNRAFADFGTGCSWSEEYYDQLQNRIGGGKEKMRAFFGEVGWPNSSLGLSPTTEAERSRLVDALQLRKTEIFQELVREAGPSAARPGIVELIDRATEHPNWKVAICSAATRSAAVEVLDVVLGKDRVAKLDLMLLGDDVTHKKPHPEVYLSAAERLTVAPEECVVIEDSKVGLEAAVAAGMPCLVTPTQSTMTQDFSEAVAVVPDARELLSLPTLHSLAMDSL